MANAEQSLRNRLEYSENQMKMYSERAAKCREALAIIEASRARTRVPVARGSETEVASEDAR